MSSAQVKHVKQVKHVVYSTEASLLLNYSMCATELQLQQVKQVKQGVCSTEACILLSTRACMLVKESNVCRGTSDCTHRASFHSSTELKHVCYTELKLVCYFLSRSSVYVCGCIVCLYICACTQSHPYTHICYSNRFSFCKTSSIRKIYLHSFSHVRFSATASRLVTAITCC
jgi:hypothetical protein